MATEYITLSELKNTSELMGVSFADYDAMLAISAASRGIDEYTGRQFFSSTGTRYFTPTEPGFLEIEDLISGTVMSDDDGDGVFETTWVANTDYMLSPLNAAADGKPYEQLRVHPNSSARLPCWPRSVSVVGTFGWSACPDPVKTATILMAARLMKRAREAPFGIVGLGIDNVAVRISRTDPDIAFLLDPYIRGSGVMIA